MTSGDCDNRSNMVSEAALEIMSPAVKACRANLITLNLGQWLLHIGQARTEPTEVASGEEVTRRHQFTKTEAMT